MAGRRRSHLISFSFLSSSRRPFTPSPLEQPARALASAFFHLHPRQKAKEIKRRSESGPSWCWVLDWCGKPTDWWAGASLYPSPKMTQNVKRRSSVRSCMPHPACGKLVLCVGCSWATPCALCSHLDTVSSCELHDTPLSAQRRCAKRKAIGSKAPASSTGKTPLLKPQASTSAVSSRSTTALWPSIRREQMSSSRPCGVT